MQKTAILLLILFSIFNVSLSQRRRNFFQHGGGNRGRRNFQNYNHGARPFQQQLYQRFPHDRQQPRPLIAQNNCRHVQLTQQTNDRIYGNLLLDTVIIEGLMNIEIEFDRPVVGFANNLTPSVSEDNRIFKISDVKSKELEFFVNYYQDMPPPIILKLKLNGKQLCPNENLSGSCADIEMITNRTKGRYEAVLTIYPHQIYNGARKLDLIFDSPSLALGNDLGESVTKDQKHFTIFNGKNLNKGQPLIINFFVKFDEFEELPKLINLYIDDLQIDLPQRSSNNIERSNIYSTQKQPPANTIESSMLLSDLPFNSFPRIINSPQQVNNDNFECGLTGNVITTRVNDGLTAHPAQFPFHVAIFYDLHYRCGATIISEKASVSASHCVVDPSQNTLPAENFHLLFGSTDLQSLNGNEAVRQVSQVIKHPNYQQDKILKQDIALLIIKGNLQFTQHIRPICLPDALQAISESINEEFIVIGFGSSTESLKLSRYLHYGKMTIISREKCTEKLILALLPEQSTFCATASSNMLACPGDSGGGIIEMVNSKFYLRGIASVTLTEANGRCNVENPVGFTDVKAFLVWLRDHL